MLSLAICGGPPAQAQDGDNPAVIVNQDILNNLEWAAAAAAQARAQAGTSATLLPPPESAPQSRVLVKPMRQAITALPAPAPVPESAAEPKEAPGPSAAEPGAPDTGEEDTWSGFAIAAEPAAAEPADAGSLPAVPAPPEPPAPEETSLTIVPPPPEPPAETPAAPQTAAPAAEPATEPLQAPEAEAPDESAPATATTVTQTAMVAPPELTAGAFRLLFAAGATTLSETAKGRLATLAEQLRAAPERRIQVQAFAGGEASARDARRLSLSRAVAVRSFLIEQGLPAGQIDVRALGGDSGGGPADRVDVLDTRG